MGAKQLDLVIEQGKTFTRIIRWETTPLVWKPITAIAAVAPVLITAAGHGLTDGWKVAVRDVVGMLDINAKYNPPRDDEFRPCTYVSASQIAINTLSAASFDPYVSGGYVVYYTAVNLTGYLARMKIKDRIGGTVFQEILTQAGTGFSLSPSAQTITLTILAVDTAAYEWLKGVYDIEMVDGAGVVTAIFSGAVEVVDEVTT
jgi:hypothetical protein